MTALVAVLRHAGYVAALAAGPDRDLQASSARSVRRLRGQLDVVAAVLAVSKVAGGPWRIAPAQVRRDPSPWRQDTDAADNTAPGRLAVLDDEARACLEAEYARARRLPSAREGGATEVVMIAGAVRCGAVRRVRREVCPLGSPPSVTEPSARVCPRKSPPPVD